MIRGRATRSSDRCGHVPSPTSKARRSSCTSSATRTRTRCTNIGAASGRWSGRTTASRSTPNAHGRATTPRLTEEGYVGLDVHKGARIAAVGNGRQVLLSQGTRALVDADVRDLGPHRLKDLSAPERIFQLEIEGLPSEFPLLKTLEAGMRNLPAIAAAREAAAAADIDEFVAEALAGRVR